MSGYLNFKPTGVDVIDNIIEELEYAGTSYHNTAYWEEESFSSPGKTHIQLIQEALDKAANAYLLRCSTT